MLPQAMKTKMTAKNHILLNEDKTHAISFSLERKKDLASIGYTRIGKGLCKTKLKEVSIADADRIYAQAIDNGYKVGF